MKRHIVERIKKNQNKKILHLSNESLKDSDARDFLLLNRIEELDLFNNSFKTIIDPIINLDSLKILNLSKNYIKVVPNLEGKWPNLKSLNLKENGLTDTRGLNSLCFSLQKLVLANNNLTQLNIQFDKFNLLNTLDLSGNSELKLFPKSLLKTKITELNLSNTGISSLPLDIGEMSELVSLDLSDNGITELPESIGKLVKLKYLKLQGNSIHKLPKSFKNLISLTDLHLERNPIGDPPIEIANQSMGAVITYYKYMGESVELNEAKLLVVGRGGVGKTRLINLLVNKVSQEPISTEGIDILTWSLNIDQQTPNKEIKKVRLNAWDFGGQEIYHSTHQFFLTKRSVYLFVWEARSHEESDITFDYWLNVVKLLSNSSPVIIVMNKSDERSLPIDEKAISEQFKNVKSFLRVSAKNKTGIDSLESEIIKEISQLNHIHDPVPRMWNDVRKALGEIEKNYIPYEDYIAICARNGINKEDSKTLSQYYHDLGTFLHFTEHPTLRSVVFLKPEWATNAVYKILHLPGVMENNGKFTLDLVESHLVGYTHLEIGYVIELMRKFELCFQISDKYYIIPQLLSPSEIDDNWDYDENISMMYQYDFMPTGIIPRLTVRMKSYIDQDKFWKHGVILSYKGAKAQVVSNHYSRTISIRCRGKQNALLLERINGHLEEINATLNNPKHELQIQCICSSCAGTEEPYMFPYNFLIRLKEKGQTKAMCQNSLINLEVNKLLSPYEPTVALDQLNDRSYIFSFENFSSNLISISVQILERLKGTEKENDINDMFTDLLRAKDYNISDQTRSGKSNTGKSVGEIDIMVRNEKQTPSIIIEGIRIMEFGMGNPTIYSHIKKILMNYNSSGVRNLYLLVYAKTNYFKKFQENYFEYLTKLPDHHLYGQEDGDLGLKDVSRNEGPVKNHSMLSLFQTTHEVKGIEYNLHHLILRVP